MPRFVDASNIGDAWLSAYRHLLAQRGRTEVNLAVNIAQPLEEDLHVRAALERALAGWSATLPGAPWHSVHTVANTIFPISLYRPGHSDSAQRFFERAAQVSRQHDRRKHEWGTYIGRLVSYQHPGGGEVNQLARFLDVLGKDTNWADGYEAPLTYPGESSGGGATASDLLVIGPEDRRLRGGPCLAHISLTSMNGALHLTAQYRRHHYLARAYGNFLGLARLLSFLAQESGREVGGMLVVGTHAEIDPGPRRDELESLLRAATLAQGSASPIEVAARPLGASWRDLELPRAASAPTGDPHV